MDVSWLQSNFGTHVKLRGNPTLLAELVLRGTLYAHPIFKPRQVFHPWGAFPWHSQTANGECILQEVLSSISYLNALLNRKLDKIFKTRHEYYRWKGDGLDYMAISSKTRFADVAKYFEFELSGIPIFRVDEIRFALDQHIFFSIWYHCAQDKTKLPERWWFEDSSKFRINITDYKLGGIELLFDVVTVPATLSFLRPGATSFIIHAIGDQLPSYPHYSSRNKRRYADNEGAGNFLDSVFIVSDVHPNLAVRGEHAMALDWNRSCVILDYIKWSEYMMDWKPAMTNPTLLMHLLMPETTLEGFFLFACQDANVVTESTFLVQVWKSVNFSGWVDFWSLRTKVCHSVLVIQKFLKIQKRRGKKLVK